MIGPVAFRGRCPCGSAVEVDIGGFGRPRLCPSCQVPFKIIWAFRPGTRERAPLFLRAGASPSSIRIPAGAREVVCLCGQHLLARGERRSGPARCPVCDRLLHLEDSSDKEGSGTRVRAVGSPPGETAAKGAYPGEDMLCLCGESLRVSAEHLGRQGKCPRCGAIVKLERERDPQTGRTRVRPRFVSKPEEASPDRWSLEDFK